jgi:serine/threonine protein kinase
LGHDQSSDLWAFGVLLHEMFVAVTPFAPKKADNVTELFTNIAMVKKNGLKLMPRLAQKDAQANSLVQMLLKAEPVE